MRLIIFRFVIFAAIGVLLAATQIQGQVRLIGDNRQLFVDDWIVESQTNILRKPGTVDKSPNNPILSTDKPWDAIRADLYGSAVWDPIGNRLQVFYSAESSYSPYDIRLAYAESNDAGTTWTKPNLGIIPFGESRQTNLILNPAAGDGAGTGFFEGPCVFRDEHESDANKLYKLFTSEYYSPGLTMTNTDGFKRTAGDSVDKAGMYVAFSPDGINWTRPGTEPVSDVLSDTTQSAFWDARIGKYVAYVRALLPGVVRGVGRMESNDFLTWTEPELILQGTTTDRQIYSLGVTPYQGIYMGTPWIFNPNATGDDPVMWPELAVSRDGAEWTRLFEGNPLIPTGEAGSADSLQIRMSSSMVELDDKILLVFAQSNDPHNAYMNAEIGMATMRLDGFASMEAGSAQGTILTKPFLLEGESLYLNAACNAAEQGWVRVAVLDEEGTPLQNFTSTSCNPIADDGVRLPVAWNRNHSLNELMGQVVRLEFQMQNADLYSFTIPKSSASKPVSGTISYQANADPTEATYDGYATKAGVQPFAWLGSASIPNDDYAGMDGGTPVWICTDSAASGDPDQVYHMTPNALDKALAASEGWTLTANLRLSVADSIGYTFIARYFDGENKQAWCMQFKTNGVGMPATVGINYQNSTVGYVLEMLDAGIDAGYHNYQLVYDPANPGVVDFLVDGNVLGTDLAPLAYAKAYDSVAFGDLSSNIAYPEAEAFFRSITWQAGIFVKKPGDADYNGKVDEADAAILAKNWLATRANWGMGDFNDDGKVDDMDAALLAANWHYGVNAASASIPEPSVVIMFVAVFLGMLACIKQYN